MHSFDVVRSHFGSRAVSVQVNSVAVSDHVFHSSLLVSCSHVFALSRSLSLGLVSHPHVVDASDRPVPKSPVQISSSNFGSPNDSGSDLDGMGTRPGRKVRHHSFTACTTQRAGRANSYHHEVDVPNGLTRHNCTWRICG